MSIVNAKEIMIPAAKEGWAVGAFNVTDLLQFEAVIDAAIEKRTPVIVQTSVKPSQFLGTQMMVNIFRTLAESEALVHKMPVERVASLLRSSEIQTSGISSMVPKGRTPLPSVAKITRRAVASASTVTY